MPALPFPLSSTPGAQAGEGEGRLLNAYMEKAGDSLYCRRVPGLSTPVWTMSAGTPRGILYNPSSGFYQAQSGGVYYNGTGIGTLTGTDPVSWAQNTAGTIMIVCRSAGGAYVVTTGVAAYPDADLPADVNSVSFLDGYFIFTRPNGQIWATDLNSTAVNPLSFATAESRPDGLVRGIVRGGVFYAVGASTIEPWIDVGASPFPLTRGTSVIPCGLKTFAAVAGDIEGWDRDIYFVAHDGTVRALIGYTTKVVSTPDVERFIRNSTESTLEACVYTFGGNAIWSLSSDIGTWELNVTTGAWHERLSTGAARWRGSKSVKASGTWYVGDTLSNALLTIGPTTYTENGSALTWAPESGAMKDYPLREVIPAIFAHFTKAAGINVAISWSHDGGSTWSTPVTRSLANADKFPIRVNRAGQTTHHGFRLRLSISDVGAFSFMGANVPDAQARAA